MSGHVEQRRRDCCARRFSSRKRFRFEKLRTTSYGNRLKFLFSSQIVFRKKQRTAVVNEYVYF